MIVGLDSSLGLRERVVMLLLGFADVWVEVHRLGGFLLEYPVFSSLLAGQSGSAVLVALHEASKSFSAVICVSAPAVCTGCVATRARQRLAVLVDVTLLDVNPNAIISRTSKL